MVKVVNNALNHYLIYSALCNELPKYITEQVDYQIQQDQLDYSKDYQIAIKVMDISPARNMLDGSLSIGAKSTIVFNFQSGQTPDSEFVISSIIDDITSFLLSLHNTKITTTDNYEMLSSGKIHRVQSETDRQVANASGINISVANTKIRTAAQLIAKSKETGRALYSLTASILFTVLGNNIVETHSNDDTNSNSSEEEQADSSGTEQD